MNEPVMLGYALVACGLRGGSFVLCLWWTVRQGVSAKRVLLLFLGSMLLRTCSGLLGYYVVSGGNWKRLLAALLGFIIARLIATRLARVGEHASQLAQKAGRAP